MGMAQNWYLLWTNPKCEMKAEEKLKELGLETYVPAGMKLVTIRTRKGRVKIEKDYPAFQRYVFIGTDRMPDWMAIRSTDGVRGVVCNEGCPIRIKDEVIGDIQTLQDLGEFNTDEWIKWDARRRGLQFLAGDQVMIVSGPLEGHSAVVKRKPNGILIDLLLATLGCKARVSIDLIEKVVA